MTRTPTCLRSVGERVRSKTDEVLMIRNQFHPAALIRMGTAPVIQKENSASVAPTQFAPNQQVDRLVAIIKFLRVPATGQAKCDKPSHATTTASVAYRVSVTRSKCPPSLELRLVQLSRG